jgi:hypothetical protein
MACPSTARASSAHTAGMAVGRDHQPLFPQAGPEIEALGKEKEALLSANAYRAHVAALPGLLELMARADAAGVPMAVGTAAPPGNIDIVLDTLGLRSRFATIIAPSAGLSRQAESGPVPGAAERMKVAPESLHRLRGCAQRRRGGAPRRHAGGGDPDCCSRAMRPMTMSPAPRISLGRSAGAAFR